MGVSGFWKTAVAWVCALFASGCATGGSATYVEGALRPRHFVFHELVKQRGKTPGGWMAACLHVGIARDTGELFYCRFGVEMPIANSAQGTISMEQAQSLSASCANQAARATFAGATPATPIGIACEEFKTVYDLTLKAAIEGAQVMKVCARGIKPVVVTPMGPTTSGGM
ncbi:hypothetical protein [Corallococcus aberystwythensis]|uniref:Lipoprotein n=1 Tax=Corallococcus aberystwythensis TaxID=2316722 RepID=A0A3A8QQX8_9BACT|nr:hypothetical protein [Corallococcus aberystwythensis]RKH65564.1 hypothetical protein D7W81_16725 [Corallococcus aberystwythensis]